MAREEDDTAKEENYWREHHAAQSYVSKEHTFEHYAPAYRTGYEAAAKYPGKKFEEIEDDVALDYERNRAGSPLPWDSAQHATRAAWDRISGVVSPRDPSRGIRSGL